MFTSTMPRILRYLRQYKGARNFATAFTPENAANMYRGVYPIVVTPFSNTRTETIDFQSFRRCISFMKQTDVTGVTVAGVLGESNRLTDWERQTLVITAAEEIQKENGRNNSNKKLKLCVGTTHTGTAATVALSQMALECGADGVMISPTKPAFGAQPTDDDILHLYQRVAETCPDLSIIVQDLPSLTGVYMSTSLLARIASTVPSVASIKLESPPTVHRIVSLRDDPSFATSNCTILCGLGALYAGFDLRQGIAGFMTGFAFPEILVAMMELVGGNDQDLLALYQKYLDLIVFEQQPGGLTIRKEIYKRSGLIDSANLRLPGGKISPALQQSVDDQLQRSFPGVDLSRPLPLEYLRMKQ